MDHPVNCRNCRVDHIFRFLLAATLSTIVGPTRLLQLRSAAEMSAIQDLLAKVDPEKFKALFGADVAQAQSLIESKALTISKLVRIRFTEPRYLTSF